MPKTPKTKRAPAFRWTVLPRICWTTSTLMLAALSFRIHNALSEIFITKVVIPSRRRGDPVNLI